MRTSRLPLADNPRRVTADIGTDFVRLKLLAGALFRAFVRLVADYIANPLRSALYSHRPDFHLDVKISDPGKRTIHYIRPIIPLFLYRTLLGNAYRGKQRYQRPDFG